jgi:beta-lactamase class A
VDTSALSERINQITAESGARDIGVAFYDYETEQSFALHGDTPFHAASTIKVPILLAVFDAVDQGRYSLETKVHVRNRFKSLVGDEYFRVSAGRDANSKVHAARGKKLTIRDLAYHMIVTSSNLATNLLLDVVGLDRAKETLQRLNLTGIELYRGVEDDKAHEAGIDNKVTANGLLEAFRVIEEGRAISKASSEKMLEILHQQEFKSGIPAGVPSNAKVAHKTGEISTVAHDTGLVFPENRKPYAVVILTEWEADKGERQTTLAKISKLIYQGLVEKEVEHA